MTIASHFAENGNDTEFNLMFVAFSGEEHGLFGSKYFVHSAQMPQNVAGMINMDMIGRPFRDNNDYVYALMSRKGKRFMKKSMASVSVENLNVIQRPPFSEKILYKYSSDHFRFHHAGIPILVLFTGLHSEYHTPKDTPDKIAYQNLENIVLWLIKLVPELKQ